MSKYVKFNTGNWTVRPDYGKENVYRLWDKDENYFSDTTPDIMDSNAALMSASPLLLRVCLDALQDWQDLGHLTPETIKNMQIAITKARL